MNSLENMPMFRSNAEQDETQKNVLSSRINSLMKDFPAANSSKEVLKSGEDALDAKMAEMSREELLNLAMDIKQYLEEPSSGFADENTYVRFATVYGAVCAQLEKLDERG